MKISLFLWIICLSAIQLNAQLLDYQFSRELKGLQDTWHQITLPAEVYAKTQNSLADIRIVGITEKGDTIEAPYLLEKHDWELAVEEIAFKLINESKSGGDTYFTFKLTNEELINRIKLNFSNKNFDWLIDLEGSQNQKQWFKIKEKQRVLAISNSYTNYSYTTISFPESQYVYWRIRVKGKEKPSLTSASLRKVKIISGDYRTYPITNFQVAQEKEKKQTIVSVDLLNEVPITYVQLQVKDKFDYYRPIQIEYRTRVKALNPVFSSLKTGLLTSFEENSFQVPSQITNGIRCKIDNRDNQPLQIDSVRVIGPSHSLKIRFTQKATYYLVYGNPQANHPNYDIVMFQDKIPATISNLDLGKETEIAQIPTDEADPLITNQLWLWVILVLLVVVIGTFGVKMLKS